MAYLGNSSTLYDPTRSSPTTPQVFSGDGYTTNFTLNKSVGCSTDIIVMVENVLQQPDYSYTAIGNLLSFSGAPGVGTNNIYVVYEKVAGLIGTVPDGSITSNKLANNIRLLTTDQYVATGSQSTFNLSDTPYDANSLIVTVNGITQAPPINYTISGNTVIFTSAPPNGANVIIRNIGFRTTQTLYALTPGTPIVQPVITGGTLSSANVSNSSFSGSANLISGILQVPVGNTATRPSNPNIGYLRYNTQTLALENYTANGWFKVSVQAPLISTISGTIYSGVSSTLTISGQNFGVTGATVTFNGANTASVTGLTPTNAGTTLVVTVPSSIYSISGGSSVGITVTNSDGATSAGYSMTIVGLPSGGTITSSGNTRIHTFTSSGTLTVPTGFNVTASYLVVAGGGSGGTGSGLGHGVCGGGGAGGMVTGTTSISVGSYSITIGSGASSAPGGPAPGGWNGSTGSPSSLGPSITASGGGYGGGQNSSSSSGAGGPGGSGGGGTTQSGSGYSPFGPAPGGSGTPGQGNPGGAGMGPVSPGGAGGGGGAGASGTSYSPTTYSGTGGVGLSSSISGSPVYYAGGGGGGGSGLLGSPPGPAAQYAGGLGGNGGGGPGAWYQPSGMPAAYNTNGTGANGTTNTGGGGGGGANGSTPSAPGYSTSGAGGSGVVIISYTV